MHPKVFERAKITQVHLQIKLPKFRETKISEADTPHLSVFSPNARKYGPEKLQIRTLFMQCFA